LRGLLETPRSRPSRALSSEPGSVKIRWCVAADEAVELLRFEWLKTGGPTVHTPLEPGFGSKLIRSAVNSNGAISYPSTGLRWEFTVPLAGLDYG
jgi:two-component sensor histidine kinase